MVEGWWAGNHHRVVALYDYEKCVQILINDGMDDLEAREFIDLSVTGAYVGEGTPAALVWSTFARRRSASAGTDGAVDLFLPAHHDSQEETAARLRFQVASAH